MDELERRKSASNSSQDVFRGAQRSAPCYNHVQSFGNFEEQVTQPMYCKEDLLKMSNYHFSNNNQMTPTQLYQMQFQRKPLKVAKCSAESFQFLSKKKKRPSVQIPPFLNDSAGEETYTKTPKNDSYASMFEATKQFFSKTKTSETSLQKVEQKPSKKLEISSEISINHITSGSSMICKKMAQPSQCHNNQPSPNQKNMDLWLSSQSIIPSIEENSEILTESAPEIEEMINNHMNQQYQSAFCFDMPQEIFYDLD